MYSKGTICLSFSDAFGKAKSTNDVLSRKTTLRKEQKICSFCGESHSSCSQKEQFFCPFLMHFARQKVQMTFFFLERWRSERNKIVALFVVRAILHVVKRIFFCPFLMHLARQKVQMTFFSRKVTFRKEQNNCSFCGESHSSCSQKEQFFCPFLMHLARQKVQMTFFALERRNN